MLGYKVPAPDEAMLISGGKQRGEGAGQFRVVIGHGSWVMPVFRKARFLSLEMHKVEIVEACRTTHGIPVNVKAVVAFKIDHSPIAVQAAAQRFLGDQKKGQMEELTQKVFAGHLRSMVGRLTIEEIIRDRDKLTMEVLLGSQAEMSRMGLTVDSMQIEGFDDNGTGYIDNLSKPKQAEAALAAAQAGAQAEQEAQAAVQESQRNQAEQARQTAVARAQYKAEQDKAEALAAAAGPLAAAEAEQKVIDMQAQLVQRKAELTQQQLQVDVIKPAQAEADKIKLIAKAEAEAAESDRVRITTTSAAEASRLENIAKGQAAATLATAESQARATQLNGEATATAKRLSLMAEAEGARALADANAANDNVQVEMAKVEQYSKVAEALASGLSGSNLNILNGGEGLTTMFASLLSQFKLVKDFMSGPADDLDLTHESPVESALLGIGELVSNGVKGK